MLKKLILPPLLVITGLYVALTGTSALAGGFGRIIPPKPKIYTCPKVPSKFKIGQFTLLPHSIWSVEKTIGDNKIPAGSTVEIDLTKGDLPVVIFDGEVKSAGVLGNELHCFGTFKSDNLIYYVDIMAMASYKKCTYDGGTKEFKCTMPTG